MTRGDGAWGWDGVPPAWRGALEGAIAPGERVVAWFEHDLDARLRYGAGLLALTDRRLIALGSRGADGGDGDAGACPWDLGGARELRCAESGSVGKLELVGPEGQIACWRYTAGRAAGARALVERARGRLRSGADEEPGAGAAPAGGDRALSGGSVSAGRLAGVSSLVRLLGFVRPRLPLALVGLGLTVSATAAGLIPPYLTMPLLDDVLVPYQSGRPVDLALVRLYLAGLMGAAILAWVLGWGRNFVLAWVSERVAADLRIRTYGHLTRLSLDFFGGKRTGDLIARVSSDTDRLCYFLSVHLLEFVNDVLMIAMTAVVLVGINARLALVALVPLPLIAFLVHRVRGRLRRGFSFGSRAWGVMTSILADTIPGIRVVKAFAQEAREAERFGRANDRVLQANDRVNRLWSFFGPSVVLLTDLGLLVIWMAGVWMVCQREVTVGVLTAFVAYIGRFYARLDAMSRMVAATQRAAASAQRIFAILDRAPGLAAPADPVHPGRLRGEIELRGVGFRYGNRRVLDGIDLRIRPGEMIGLVGASGAGKTTIINLLCRFYEVEEGVLLVDGEDVRRYPEEEYRRNIGIVLQEPFLFYGTVAENIAYGRPVATREEIVAAARAARAHDFIVRLPSAYDSLCGERGQLLSGGERQRISIARALLVDPRILILDEATSSVDSETEREIRLALENLTEGRTTIAIAHRLSTLERADRLIVLDQGRIVEEGTHADLLARDGHYARLYRAQIGEGTPGRGG